MEDQDSKDFLRCFALMIVGLGSAYISSITFIPLTAFGQHIADNVEGFLIGTALSGILGFFYGSSMQSQVKDTTIANLSAPPPPPNP